MNIKVDEAISNGIYMDKDTNTLVDKSESVNFVIHDDALIGVHKIVEVIARILKLTDSETDLYYALIDNYINGSIDMAIANNVSKIANKYNKSERSIYKAIKGLYNKRVISYKGVNTIQLNKAYNFAKPFMNEQKFIIIRLID